MFSRVSSLPPIKTLAALLSLVCLCAGSALAATSPYAGSYYGLGSQNGDLVVAANITVDTAGTLHADGIYLDGSTTSISGKVDSAGNLTLAEKHGGRTTNFKGSFKPNKNKFVVKLSTGVTFKAVRIPASFPVAGVYVGETDEGAEGAFIITKQGALLGVIVDGGEAYALSGSADSNGIEGETDNGINFEGSFQNGGLSGDYSDYYGDFDGTFSASRL